MPTQERQWVSQERGSYHLMSRVAGGARIFEGCDKEYFIELLKRLSRGFFVDIHACCVMTNHFHILATCLEKDAKTAEREELLRRYQILYPKAPGPPEGDYDNSGRLIKGDKDGGIQRLRDRLGSISRFMQELKQTFSRYYNKKNDRKGTLWSDRFKSIVAERGVPQLLCSVYIDLNPVRAGIVKIPEAYRWSSIGLRVRSPGKARNFLSPLSILPLLPESGDKNLKENLKEARLGPLVLSRKSFDHFSLYREFVYLTLSKGSKTRGYFPRVVISEIKGYHGKLGISSRLRYRLKNFSEGLIFGSHSFVAHYQELWNRKHIRPRSFMDRDSDCPWSFSTRVYRK